MENKLKPYDKYKQSDATYIEMYPQHWNTTKLRFVFEERKEKNKGRKTDNILSVMKNKGVIPYSEKGNVGNKHSEDIERYNVVHEDDIVMNSMNVIIGSVGRSKYYGALSPVYYVLKNRDSSKYNIKYYEYVFRMTSLQRELTKYGKGILAHRMRIPMEMLKNLELPYPPMDEQVQIVKFLNLKISKVKRFISYKKKLISSLKEQKQVIINEVITKGINPNTTMKSSGIEWIGDIPEDWDTIRCKYLFQEIDTRSTTGLEKHLSMSQKYGLIPDDELGERRLLSENYIGGKLCIKDDLVLNRLKAHLGVFALAPQKGVISPDYTVLRPNEKIYPPFAEIVLKSQKCRKELRIRVKGIVEGFWRLYTDDFNNIVLPIPNFEEQVQIMNFINDESTFIDKTIARIEREIELLIEYQTTLISDVVTGKVDIRNVVTEGILEDAIDIEDDVEEELDTNEEVVDSEECEV